MVKLRRLSLERLKAPQRDAEQHIMASLPLERLHKWLSATVFVLNLLRLERHGRGERVTQVTTLVDMANPLRLGRFAAGKGAVMM